MGLQVSDDLKPLLFFVSNDENAMLAYAFEEYRENARVNSRESPKGEEYVCR